MHTPLPWSHAPQKDTLSQPNTPTVPAPSGAAIGLCTGAQLATEGAVHIRYTFRVHKLRAVQKMVQIGAKGTVC